MIDQQPAAPTSKLQGRAPLVGVRVRGEARKRPASSHSFETGCKPKEGHEKKNGEESASRRNKKKKRKQKKKPERPRQSIHKHTVRGATTIRTRRQTTHATRNNGLQPRNWLFSQRSCFQSKEPAEELLP
ncbi:hypothetical protein IF2G_10506 [Cordyceps javanica]|nr:hypothetical protein IF2G_10506 [Cordyceps javanica]